MSIGGGSNSSSSESRPLTGAERTDIFNSAMQAMGMGGQPLSYDAWQAQQGGAGSESDYNQYVQNAQTSGMQSALNSLGYQSPGFQSAGPTRGSDFYAAGDSVNAAAEGYNSVDANSRDGNYYAAGPAQTVTGADAGKFNSTQFIDPGQAQRLSGGDYGRLEQSIMQSRMAPLQQAISQRFQDTDQAMSDRGIYASGIGEQAKNKIYSNEFLPAINQATAEATAQRYAAEQGDNQNANAFGLSRAGMLNDSNLTQNQAMNAWQAANADRANSLGLSNAQMTNSQRQFDAAGQTASDAANAAAYNQNQQFNAGNQTSANAANANAYNTAQMYNAGNQNQFRLSDATGRTASSLANANIYNTGQATDSAAQNDFNLQNAGNQYSSGWAPLNYLQGIWNGTGGAMSSGGGSGWNFGLGR